MTGVRLRMSPRTGSDERAGPGVANAGEPGARHVVLPPRGAAAGTVRSDDPLADMVVRVHADFGEQTTLAEILAVIDRCRTGLDASGAAGQAAWWNNWSDNISLTWPPTTQPMARTPRAAAAMCGHSGACPTRSDELTHVAGRAAARPIAVNANTRDEGDCP